MKYYEKIDENGFRTVEGLVYQVSHPQIELGGELVNDPSYIDAPIPNDIYISDEFPPKWNGTQWIETGTPPELVPQEPTELELLMLAISELDMQRELDRTDNQVAIAELAESLMGGF